MEERFGCLYTIVAWLFALFLLSSSPSVTLWCFHTGDWGGPRNFSHSNWGGHFGEGGAVAELPHSTAGTPSGTRPTSPGPVYQGSEGLVLWTGWHTQQCNRTATLSHPEDWQPANCECNKHGHVFNNLSTCSENLSLFIQWANFTCKVFSLYTQHEETIHVQVLK